MHLMAKSLNIMKYCGTAVDLICGGYNSKIDGEATGCRSVVLDSLGEGFSIHHFKHLEFSHLHCKQLMTTCK